MNCDSSVRGEPSKEVQRALPCGDYVRGAATETHWGWVRKPKGSGSWLHVLVLNYNGRKLLERCLPSVLCACRNVSGGAMATVIDNESEDDSREWVFRHFPDVGLYLAPNRGLASFNEVAFQVSEPVVALCNNDILPAPDAFSRLLDTLQRCPSAFGVGPHVRSACTGEYEGCAARLRFRRGVLHTEVPSEPDDGELHFAPSSGVVLVAWRTKFAALGGYSQVYFPGRFEDLELCWRAWRAGWPVLMDSRALVEHLDSATFRQRYTDRELSALDLRNAVICTLRNVRSPVKLAAAGFWFVARVLERGARLDWRGVQALIEGVRTALLGPNRWPLALRRVGEKRVLQTLAPDFSRRSGPVRRRLSLSLRECPGFQRPSCDAKAADVPIERTPVPEDEVGAAALARTASTRAGVVSSGASSGTEGARGLPEQPAIL